MDLDLVWSFPVFVTFFLYLSITQDSLEFGLDAHIEPVGGIAFTPIDSMVR